MVREVTERYPQWFEHQDGALTCTEKGLAALGRELVARGVVPSSTADWLESYNAIAAERGTPKRALDQVYATAGTVVRRAELLALLLARQERVLRHLVG